MTLCASKTLSHHQDTSPGAPVLRQGNAPMLCECRTHGDVFLLAQLVWLQPLCQPVLLLLDRAHTVLQA